MQAVLFRDLAYAGGYSLAVEHQSPRGFVAQHHVFGHGERRHQHEMLVHHANPLANGVGGALDVDTLTVNVDFSLVRRIKPVEDIHQRAFSGAVFTQQGMDFTFFQGQIDVVVGQNARKTFGDTTKFKNWGHNSLSV